MAVITRPSPRPRRGLYFENDARRVSPTFGDVAGAVDLPHVRGLSNSMTSPAGLHVRRADSGIPEQRNDTI